MVEVSVRCGLGAWTLAVRACPLVQRRVKRQLVQALQRLVSECQRGLRDRQFSDPADLRHAAIESRNQFSQLVHDMRASGDRVGVFRSAGHKSPGLS